MSKAGKLIKEALSAENEFHDVVDLAASGVATRKDIMDALKPTKAQYRVMGGFAILGVLLFIIATVLFYFLGLIIMFFVYFRIERNRGSNYNLKRLIVKTLLWPVVVFKSTLHGSGVNYL